MSPDRGRDWPLRAVIGALVLGAAVFVTASLRRPEVPTFAPTRVAVLEAGQGLVGPRTFTVDASHPDRWRYFDFSRGTVVDAPGPMEWDLAFRRFQVAVNGGEGFGGAGGLLALGAVPFDSVTEVPRSGYVEAGARRDSTHPLVERWYDYSWTSHLLTPRPDVYAVRTADGRYAKLQFVGYYCEGAVSGCLTFRYVYQGGGGTRVAP